MQILTLLGMALWAGLLTLSPPPSPSTTLTYTHTDNFEVLLPDFLAGLAESLAAHGIALEAADGTPDLHFSAELACARADCIFVHIMPAQPDRLPLSAALAARHHYPLHIGLPLEPSADRIAAATEQALGIALYSADRCAEAVSYLESDPELWIILPDPRPFYAGNCALLRGDFDGAVDYFERAIVPYSDARRLISSAPAVNLAWLAIQRGDAEAVEHWLGELARSEDDGVAVLEQRARLHALSSDYDTALDLMDAAIAADGDSAPLYTLRGQFALALYEWGRALADYNRALTLDADYAPAHYHRGILHYSILQTGLLREAALADFERYLDLDPAGNYATQAAAYVQSIRAELAALDAP